MNKKLNILFGVLILLLFVPLAQEYFHMFRLTPLQGAWVPAQKPSMGVKQWFTGSCQDSLSTYYNENFGLRSFFVRVNNQLDYSLFRKTTAAKIVIGRHGYLFENNYLEAYHGDDFLGEGAIDTLVMQAAKAQKLLRERNVDMLLVLAPGKATFFPEHVPWPYNTPRSNPTNYELITRKCTEAGIHCIDMNQWFRAMKDTATYPLYPKCGIHWSYYGMYLAADSIIRRIEAIRHIDMPEMHVSHIETDVTQRGTDYDIGHIMNLLLPIETYPMAYPVIGYSGTEKLRPDVLVIGDSYYWNMYYSGIPAVMFKNLDFYYYNSSIYNDGTNIAAGTTDKINYESEILKRDVIVVMQTDGGLNNFGFGFFNRVCNELQGFGLEARIENFRQAILADPKWKQAVADKAVQRGISFEEMLYIDAKYMAEQ